MSNLPPLGGFNFKLAGAYLLPPAKPMKKKKPLKSKPIQDEEKAAALLDAIMRKEAANTLSHLASYNFASGWKK
jgi:hypothetical protein